MSENVVAPATAESIARSAAALEHPTMRRVSARPLPLLLVLFVCNIIDRTNLAIAELLIPAPVLLRASPHFA